ncbi:FAD-dependent oxidoreductase [bacterium]|nr:FAD-dependent oxidoreductase [bacterium]
MARSKILLALALLALALLLHRSGLLAWLNLAQLQAHLSQLHQLRDAHPLTSGLVFFTLYVLVAGLSLPGATLLTLAGGAIFGLAYGTLLVSFASSLGATGSFAASRYFLRDWVQSRWGSSLGSVHRGLDRDGPFYLFTLRLVPAFPFFLVNLMMGLTPMPISTFYWVSQLGMIPGTLVYVNAGMELASLQSLSGILSSRLILAFTLLGLLPWAGRWLQEQVRLHRLYGRFSRPRKFDRNILVIGAGSAGLVTAYIAAAVRAKVTLVEKHKMGGDCLNTGCVPSKTLIQSAKLAHSLTQAQEFGVTLQAPGVDFGAVMERVHKVIAQVEPHDSVERYTGLGVECIQGRARFISPWEVEIECSQGTQRLSARHIVIATGARPTLPAVPGLSDLNYWTSDTIWNLRQLPARLLVLGAGPIGCELAQSFARLGSKVVMVDQGERLLRREDPEISWRLAEQLRAEGLDLRLCHRPLEFGRQDGVGWLRCEHQGQEVRLEFDEVLCAVGRTANTRGFGLEELGVQIRANQTLAVNDFLETNYPNILACGDVAGPYQFTHVAAHQAWFAAVNSLFGGLRRFRADYSVIPWATFTDPEVARVGLNEQEARQQGVAYEVTRYDLEGLDRAIADGTNQGEVKVLTVPGRDKILGVTIVGPRAGDLLAEFVLAMRHGLGLNQILSTIHIYPTMAEANKYVAGEWKKAHKPERVLAWLEKFHNWMRG